MTEFTTIKSRSDKQDAPGHRSRMAVKGVLGAIGG